jgi:catechol 2,3-dioxygenase-like lactoylglutathione lyase family enzyme
MTELDLTIGVRMDRQPAVPAAAEAAGFTKPGAGNPVGHDWELRSVVIDCRDPHQLAAFYAEMLGGREVRAEDESWVVVTDPAGRRLAFQRSPAHEPPQFPDPRGSQQFHLDLQVDDVDEAERKVLALGATRVRDAVEDGSFRVFRDPAGHTFCLVWGVADPGSVVAATGA